MRKALVELLDAKPHLEHLPALLVLAKDDWSPRFSYQGEEDDYLIEQAAIDAIGKLGLLEGAVADELYRLATDTRAPDLRYETFALLVRAADARFQGQPVDLAVDPGRRPSVWRRPGRSWWAMSRSRPRPPTGLRRSCSLHGSKGVASRLLLLVALCAEMDQACKAAEAQSTVEKRRVLLLVVIWIAPMLPANHAGVK